MNELEKTKAKIEQILEDAPSLLTVDYLKENETRTTEQIFEQFINDYAEWIEKARKDILVILVGLEKTHVVVEKKQLRIRFNSINVKNAEEEMSELIKELLGVKAE